MRITAQSMARGQYLSYKVANGNNNANAVNSMLSSLSGSLTASSNDMMGLAVQQASLKANSKTLRGYYKNMSADDRNAAVKAFSNTSQLANVNTTAEKKLASSSESLSRSATKLAATGAESLFKPLEDGTYDMDKIASAVQSFADDYNAARSAVLGSSSSSAIQTAVSMVKGTQAHESSLNKVGITINRDNSLSVNADKLKSSDINDIKSLFNGSGSYANGVAKQAAQMRSSAQNMLPSKYAGTRTTGSLFDAYA